MSQEAKMKYDPREDARTFGEDAWIYCGSHMRPHKTGWCTANIDTKHRLEATSAAEAIEECRRKQLALYADRKQYAKG